MCMSRLGIIYKVTNKINGKIYIGKTVKSLSRRRAEHHSGIENTDNVFKGFKGALQKYGKEQFVWEILEECPIEELNSREVHYIEEHKSYMKGIGYNLTKGCTLIDPYGIVHEVMGIRLFAHENGLDNSSVSKLINGKLKTHKGWRLYEDQ